MKIFLGLFIAIFVLTLTMDVQTRKTDRKKDIKKSVHTNKLQDKNKNPKNIRTKIDMIKSLIHGFLHQLDLPDRICEIKIREASVNNLMKVTKLFNHVKKGISKPVDLAKIKDYLNYPEVEDRLKNEKYAERAIKYIKKFNR
jgi:hypothetical protein